MNIAIIGGAGFIGTNLMLSLAKEKNNNLKIIDKKMEYFNIFYDYICKYENICLYEYSFDQASDFDKQVNGCDIVFHLASTNIPGNSNTDVAKEIESNVGVTAKLLDACVRQNVKKVIFLSSGGAVYGANVKCPISEEILCRPITSYGVQKIAIENLLYLYNYQYGLDYRVIRLANPYGPYQRPNGKLGVITTFVYKALMKETIEVYGDGSVVRDFIYIDDAIKGIINITNYNGEHKLFNLGSGKGTSINEIIEMIRKISPDIIVRFNNSRKVDIPINYLDVSRYEKHFGKCCRTEIEDGIKMTLDFFERKNK